MNLWKATFIVALSLIFCTNCNRIPQSDQELDDVREAIFRYQFTNNKSYMQSSAPAFCLLIENEQSPGLDLLNRFNGSQPPVKGMQDCERKPPENGHAIGVVIDRTTRRQALLFRIQELQFIDDENVEGKGGYFENGTSGSVSLYRSTKRDGKWVITEEKLIAISQSRWTTDTGLRASAKITLQCES